MLNPDFRAILFAFPEDNVEYLLVDAYALAAHGQASATADIDLWAKSREDNAARIVDALANFGVEVAGLKGPVSTRHHLLQNKRATSRPMDLADADWLARNEEQAR